MGEDRDARKRIPCLEEGRGFDLTFDKDRVEPTRRKTVGQEARAKQ